ILTAPIERRLPALLLDDRPAIRQPEFSPAIAAIGDEFAVFAARHRIAGESKRVEPDFVAWPLVIEGEARAGMTDLMEPAGKLNPAARCARLHRIGARRLVGRKQRID